jgi:hypothetical protein
MKIQSLGEIIAERKIFLQAEGGMRREMEVYDLGRRWPVQENR